MSYSIFRFPSRMAILALCFAMIAALSPLAAQEVAPDEGEAMVRINRLENMMRQMQGQIEELQFANQKLQDQLKFMTQTGESRAPMQAQPNAVQAPAASAQPQQIPKALEMPSPSAPAPVQQNNSGPINLMAAGKAPQTPAAPSGPGAPPMTLEQAAAAAASVQVTQAPAQAVAPVPAQQPVEQKSNFELAKDAMAAKDYEKAANILTGIVEGNPKEAKIPDALMLLGDAQFRLKRYPEAAQRYLKLAQTYPKHPEAPMAFVRLGSSLNEMGQKPQACATFAEFAKRYPAAKAAAKAEADRGKKAASCG